MTAVEKYLFTPLFAPRNNWAVVGWWESRRPLYNLLVGASGLLSLGIMALVHPGPPAMYAMFAAVYGVLANLGFTLGALADLSLRRLLGDRGFVAGPVLFRYGTAFSIGLSLLPIPVAIAGLVARLFS